MSHPAKRLTASALVVLTLAVSVVSAHASPARPNCKFLITDPRGDAHLAIVPTNPYDAEADLLSIDAVTTSTTLDFIVTMASVNAHPVTTTDVDVNFSVGQKPMVYSVAINHGVDGNTFTVTNETGSSTPGSIDVPGTVDPAAGTYTVRIPRQLIGAQHRATLLEGIGAITSETLGASSANLGVSADDTGNYYSYRVGYPYGCRRR